MNRSHSTERPETRRALYSPAERVRRDASRWTLVQGVLAPLQFVVFLVSLALVLRYLATGEGLAAATRRSSSRRSCSTRSWSPARSGRRTSSAAISSRRPSSGKTCVSMLVLALHTAYLVALLTGWRSPRALMLLALAAYATYVVNAAQFLLKLRAARLRAPATAPARCRRSRA